MMDHDFVLTWTRILSGSLLLGSLLLGPIALSGCAHSTGGPEHGVYERAGIPPGHLHVNPQYPFPSENLRNPGDGYPHPVHHGEKRTVREFHLFCDRIRREFGESNLTIEEASRVYDLLESTLVVQDGSYGMPSPDLAPASPVDYRKRILIRKRARDHYELFYFVIGCGKTYYLKELRSTGGEPRLYEIDRWKESYPC